MLCAFSFGFSTSFKFKGESIRNYHKLVNSTRPHQNNMHSWRSVVLSSANGITHFKNQILNRGAWNCVRRTSASRSISCGSILRCRENATKPFVYDAADQQAVHVHFSAESNNVHVYPHVWLRDNCQCEDCFHQGSTSRTINWETFDVNACPKSVSIDESSQQVKVTWSDGHQSTYTLEWLKERNFSDINRSAYLEHHYRPRKILWDKQGFQDALKSFQFSDVINSSSSLRDWLDTLARYGVAMIRDAPHTEQECRRLADRVGFIRKTHYGEEFIVRAKEGTSNVAYLSTPLQLHTDLPYYEYKPGANLLHCLVQSRSNGGENLLTDCFSVAAFLKVNHPEEYRTLSRTVVNWNDVGEEDGNKFHSIYRAPVISESFDGEVERINYSVPQRDSFFSVPLEAVQPWYRALEIFVRLIHEQAVSFKTKPGDILTFDNVRMVHGRTGYTDKEDNTRHIVGAYLDWDEIYSRLRVLNSELRSSA